MNLRNLKPGDVVDGFRLEERMVSGGMARFWRVSRDDIPTPMVMKIPFIGSGDSPLAIVGYETEQLIMPRLSGPHVPRFIATGDFDKPYVVMEMIPGRSLKSLLEQTPLPPEDVARIGAQVAYALHDLHRQKVVHLDLKPSNVILRDNGEAALIDFGLSRHLELPDLIGEEADGPVGTGPYISPEQLLGIRRDYRSDIFALGVILYFLATGERPFGDPERAAEWQRRLWRDPHPPKRWNPDIPEWLQEIVLHCLEVNLSERYTTAAQVGFDLSHPEQVPLTARATRTTRDGKLRVFARWLRARKNRTSFLPHDVRTKAVSAAPIVMVALDLSPSMTALNTALFENVHRLLTTGPKMRLACVSVRKVARITLEEPSSDGQHPNLKKLIEMKHWARPLMEITDRITYQVVEAPDPAAAIVNYARSNRVDHIVIGARGSSTMRRYLGSVSTQVVAEAPSTVTVVKLPAPAEDIAA
jgi:serine/threonine protein kinase